MAKYAKSVTRQWWSTDPCQGDLALVGDTHGVDVTRLQVGLGQCLTGGDKLGLPDGMRIMLDPTGLGIDLRQLLQRQSDNMPLGVKHNSVGTGSTLVKIEQVSHMGSAKGKQASKDCQKNHNDQASE